MTLEELTADDIAAVLPTVSTGRAMGDWTEPDDRDADAEWILTIVRRAAGVAS